LDLNKLYYLSHPFTTFGNKLENLHRAVFIEKQLLKEVGIFVINPIKLPLGDSNDTAMEKCRHLYDACDAVIFCEGWDKSRGCKEEYEWAVKDKKPIYFYEKDALRG
jgi:hypothetical protein